MSLDLSSARSGWCCASVGLLGELTEGIESVGARGWCIDDSNHSLLAVRLGLERSAVQPDRLVILDGDRESLVGRTGSSGDEPREDATFRWVTWVIEVGLHDGMILREELEGDLLANLSGDGVGSENKAVLSYGNGLDSRISGARGPRSGGGGGIAAAIVLSKC